MNAMHVKCIDGEELVRIAISWEGMVHTMNRPRGDAMVNTLRRLALKLRKSSKGQNKRGKNSSPLGPNGLVGGGAKNEGPDVFLLNAAHEMIPIDKVSNGDGWCRFCSDGEQVFLRVTLPNSDGTMICPVVLNPPEVTSLVCHITAPMAGGYSILPAVETELAEEVEWEWLVGGGVSEEAKVAMAVPSAGAKGGAMLKVVGREQLYTPLKRDVGQRLTIRCTPVGSGGQRGRPVVHVIVNPVMDAPEPGLLTLRRRWLHDQTTVRGTGEVAVDWNPGESRAGDGIVPGSVTGTVGEAGTRGCTVTQGGNGTGTVSRQGVGGKDKSRQCLRWVCYNILADMYCTSEQADKILYPYCPREYRLTSFRLQVILGELRGYQADLMFLQECELKSFNRHLNPLLGYDGFEGLYLNKSGMSQEGLAIFYRRSRLRLECSHDLVMRKIIPSMEEFIPLLESVPHLKVIVEEKLTTVAQVVVLAVEGSPGIRLVVVNTHLYFHPHASHLRLMQLVAIMNRVAEVRKLLVAEGLSPLVIVAGDLNSMPDGPVQYLKGDLVSPESEMWANVVNFKWGDRYFDEVVPETGSSAPPAVKGKAGGGGKEQGNARCNSRDGGSDQDKGTGDVMDVNSIDGGVLAGGGGTGKSSAVHAVPLPIPYLRLEAAMELASGTPAFTNFTPSFTETLDYVFVEKEGSRLLGTAPMPEENFLRALTPGLPFESFPSDHVSLVGDLQLMV